MKSNRVLGVGGFVLLAAFAMGTSAQASTLSVGSLSTDASLSMAGSMVESTGGGFLSILPGSAFDTCSGDDCSETEDAAATLIPGDGFGAPEISYAVAAAAPEPATFVLVGLTLAVLPLIRKRRS